MVFTRHPQVCFPARLAYKRADGVACVCSAGTVGIATAPPALCMPAARAEVNAQYDPQSPLLTERLCLLIVVLWRPANVEKDASQYRAPLLQC